MAEKATVKDSATPKPPASQTKPVPTKGADTMTAEKYKRTVARRLGYEYPSDLPLSEVVLVKRANRKFGKNELTEKQWQSLHKDLSHFKRGGK